MFIAAIGAEPDGCTCAKTLPIAAKEHRMPGHPHVELEILDRLPVRILDSKRKQRQALGHERAVVAHPDDASAITEAGVASAAHALSSPDPRLSG